MEDVRIEPLAADDLLRREEAASLLVAAFDDPDRYGAERVEAELCDAGMPYYRHFYLAVHEDRVVGVGGIKAAEWARDTHILYLSAVAPEARGRGIGRALVEVRVQWLLASFPAGRILVSSSKLPRFRDCGFRQVTEAKLKGPQLMLLEF